MSMYLLQDLVLLFVCSFEFGWHNNTLYYYLSRQAPWWVGGRTSKLSINEGTETIKYCDSS